MVPLLRSVLLTPPMLIRPTRAATERSMRAQVRRARCFCLDLGAEPFDAFAPFGPILHEAVSQVRCKPLYTR